MDKEGKKDSTDSPGGDAGLLSDDFRNFLNQEAITSRIWAMVDAMLEENPSLDRQTAFNEASRIISEQIVDSNDTEKEDKDV